MKILIPLLTLTFSISCSTKSPDNAVAHVDSTNVDTTNSESTFRVKDAGWKKVNVVDEFGNEVKGKSSIVGAFNGKMSNNIVTDAELIVKMSFHDDLIVTEFFEYSKDPSSEIAQEENVIFHVTKANGDTVSIEQLRLPRYMVDKKGTLVELLKNERESFTVLVDQSNAYSKTIYNFKVDPKGFADLVNTLPTN